MSYHRHLVLYALQKQSAPTTAQALVEAVQALAIEAGAPARVVNAINSKMVAALLRSWAAEGAVEQCGEEVDRRRARGVPLWRSTGQCIETGPPEPPVGLPAALTQTEPMASVVADFASDAAALITRFQAESNALVEKYRDRYFEAKS